MENTGRIDEYLYWVERSIENSCGKDKKIDSIYFGGGTPSLLSSSQVDSIIEKISKTFNIEDDCEITMEVNPGTIRSNYFNDLISLGFNRLNIGVQSFNDNHLKKLGRIHCAAKAEQTFFDARKSGFENIGLDLIFGLPDQTKEELLKDLENMIALKPDHISAYMLSIEKGTPFYEKVKNKTLFVLPDEIQADYFIMVNNFLEKNGFIFYEVSNYAASQKSISRHNYKYWTGNSYYGFGPSAHSYNHPKRWKQPDSFNGWISNIENKKYEYLEETIDKDMEETEFIYLGFRTKKGINILEYKEKFNKNFEEFYKDVICLYVKQGLLVKEEERYFLTIKGFLFLDHISLKFVELI